jgi:hypothetical protein
MEMYTYRKCKASELSPNEHTLVKDERFIQSEEKPEYKNLNEMYNDAFFINYFLLELGFKLRALGLLDRCSTT